MATWYWVGGTGTWNTSTTTNWASSSGGAGSAGVPVSTDSVIIDTNSGTGTITCTGAVCANLTVTATQAITLGASSSTLSVYGSLTYPSGGSFIPSPSIALTFSSTTTGQTITTGGKTFGAVTFNGVGGGWTLQDNFSNGAQTITLTNGSLNTNGKTLQIGSFVYSGTGTASLTLGTSTINIWTEWSISVTTGLTSSIGSATLNFTNGSTYYFYGGGLTYGTVSFTSTATGSATITGNNTYTNLNITGLASTGLATVTLPASGTQTVTGTFTVTGGTYTQRYFIQSSTLGTATTINAAAVSLSYVDFQDTTGAGAATWSGTSLGNCTGNSNITFTTAKTVYWNLAGSQNWSATAWATSSGGTPAAANFPLAQDTCIFDNNSAITTATINSNWNIGTINMSSRTTAMTISTSSNSNIYGNWTNGSGTTLSGNITLTFAGRTTQTITSAGKTFTQSITIKSIGGTVQQADALISTGLSGITLTNGTYLTQNNNLTCYAFFGSGTGTRALTLGTSTVTLTGIATVWSFATVTNLTFSGASSTIALSDTSTTSKEFDGGGLNYGTLQLGATGSTTGTAVYDITGSSTFANITSLKTVAATISLTSGTTNTFTTWSASGTSGNPLTVNSVTAGTAASIAVTNQTSGIDYLIIQDIKCTNLQPVTFYAGSHTQLNSNVWGIAATTPTANQYIHVLTSGTSWTTPANWNNTNNQIHLFAGGGGGGGGRYTSATNHAAGGGGGGGGYIKATNVSLSGSITYAIGAGGTAGATSGGAGGTGGTTSFKSGTYTAGGGGGGSTTTTPTSVGGTGGTGSTNNGGAGGVGSYSTTSAQAEGGGGGGGAGGPLGVGAIGGAGFGSTTGTSAAGGGGGGNGGGSAGGAASSATGGTGGNNNAGAGGGATPYNGGGRTGFVSTLSTSIGAGTGTDIAGAGMGGGGGLGGASQVGLGSTTVSFFGGGGGGSGTATAGSTYTGAAGGQGGIIIVYSTTNAQLPGIFFLLF